MGTAGTSTTASGGTSASASPPALTNDLNKFVCKDNKDHTVSNVTKLTRNTKYIRNENDKIFIN